MIEYKVTEFEDYYLIEFEITSLNGIMSNISLGKAIGNAPRKLKSHKGVVLSGRGPTWLYGALAHQYHPASWVAFYDPRLNGGVVVETHKYGIKLGSIIKTNAASD